MTYSNTAVLSTTMTIWALACRDVGGERSVPNQVFWGELGGLVQDGCGFALGGFKKAGGGGGPL